MSKKLLKKEADTVVYPELEDFISRKLKQPGLNTPDQLRKFWDDFNFNLGPSGIKLKTALRNQFYNTRQAIDWKNNRDEFLEDLIDIQLNPAQLNDLKLGYLYAVYNLTRESVKKELMDKLLKYQALIKEGKATLSDAKKLSSPKNKSKVKRGEEVVPIDPKALEIKLEGYESIQNVVMTQLKEFKERMVAIKKLMDESNVSSKPSSPRKESGQASPTPTSPRPLTFATVTTSPRVNSVTTARRFTMGSRKPLSTENSVEETSPVALTKIPSTSPSTSPRRDMTLESPKPTKKLPPLPKPKEVVADFKPAESKRDTVTLSREAVRGISLTEEKLEFLPPLEAPSKIETTVQKWNMGKVRTESVDQIANPVEAAVEIARVEVTVGRGRIEPVAPQNPLAVLSGGRGRGRGRGRGIQPSATAAAPADTKTSPVQVSNPSPTPKKASTSRGQPVKLPVKESVTPAIKRPAVPKFVPSRPGGHATVLPGLKFGLERPKPAARPSTLAKQPLKDKGQVAAPESVASTLLMPIPVSREDLGSVRAEIKSENLKPEQFNRLPPLELDEEDFVIPGTLDDPTSMLSDTQAKREETVEPSVDEDKDFSSESKKESGLVSKNTGLKKSDPVGEDTESDEMVQKTDADDSPENSEEPSEKVAETPRAESEVEETPRTKAAKVLAQDKASIILKAIFRSEDLSRVTARQQYKVKDYPAFNALLKKFKGFDSTPLEESYIFSEENEGFRKVMVNLFDYLIVLQKEQLKWDEMPATYHVKKSAEDKIAGLVTLFNDLVDSNSSLEKAKELLEAILASKEDKGLLQNRGTGAYSIGSFFRREKNPVNKQWIRSTVERNLVEIYNTVTTALGAETDESQADPEIEPSEAETTKISV